MTADEIETALQAFAAAGAERGLYYLSTPITTGRRELELMYKLGVTSRSELRSKHHSDWLDFVVAPNEASALEQADTFTETVALGRVVVNPILIKRKHWHQSDYDELWAGLLRRYPAAVVPLEGWAYSRGARLEVGLALQLKLPIIYVDGLPCTWEQLSADMARAEKEIVEYGLSGELDLPVLEEPSDLTASRLRDLTPAGSDEEAFARHIFMWLSQERNYQLRKFGIEQDDRNTMIAGIDADGWWSGQLAMYYRRAQVFGLDLPNGRQALAKFTATACGLLESVARVHGPLPPPGVTSGELHGASAVRR